MRSPSFPDRSGRARLVPRDDQAQWQAMIDAARRPMEQRTPHWSETLSPRTFGRSELGSSWSIARIVQSRNRQQAQRLRSGAAAGSTISVGGRVRDHATIVQKKTGRPVQFEVIEQTRVAIQAWLANAGGGNGRYLFPSRIRRQPHLSTRQYARIVHSWVASAGRDSSAYGTDSMQRTMRGLATAGPHPSEGSMAKSRPLTIEDVSPLGAEQLARLLLEAAWGMSSMPLSVSAVALPSPNGYSRQLSRCVARGGA